MEAKYIQAKTRAGLRVRANAGPNTNTALALLQPIILVLLDITPMMGVLDGVLMELQDCALPLLKGKEVRGNG